MELEPGPEDALIVVLRCSRNEIVICEESQENQESPRRSRVEEG